MFDERLLRRSYASKENLQGFAKLNKSCAPYQQGISLTNQKVFPNNQHFDGYQTVRANSYSRTLPRNYSPPLKEQNLNTLSRLNCTRVIPTNRKSPLTDAPQLRNYSPPQFKSMNIQQFNGSPQRLISEANKNAENFKNLYLQTLNEANYWKTNSQNLEKSLNKMNQKTNQIDSREFQNEISQLRDEIELLKEILDLRNREIIEWKSKFEGNGKNKGGEDIIRFQEALFLLAAENDRLHHVAKNYTDELNNLNSKLDEAEFLRENLEIINSEKHRIEIILEESKSKLRQKDLEIQELKFSQAKTSEFEIMNERSFQEISNLRLQLQEKDLIIGKTQFVETEFRSNKLLFEKIKTENLHLNSKLMEVNSQLERVEYELRIKSEEVEKFRVKSGKIDFSNSELESLRNENARFDSKCHSLSQHVSTLQSEISKLTNALNQQRNESLSYQEIGYKISSLTAERDSLQRENSQKSEELENQRGHCYRLEGRLREAEGYQNEINKLLDVISVKENELSNLLRAYKELEIKAGRYHESDNKLQELKQKLEVLVIEIERLRSDKLNLENELSSAKSTISRLESISHDNRSLEDENYNLRSDNKSLVSELEEVHQKLEWAMSFQNEVGMREQTIESLNFQISKQTKEILELQNQMGKFDGWKERIINFMMIFVIQATELESLRNQLDFKAGKEFYKEIQFSKSESNKLENSFC